MCVNCPHSDGPPCTVCRKYRELQLAAQQMILDYGRYNRAAMDVVDDETFAAARSVASQLKLSISAVTRLLERS